MTMTWRRWATGALAGLSVGALTEPMAAPAAPARIGPACAPTSFWAATRASQAWLPTRTMLHGGLAVLPGAPLRLDRSNWSGDAEAARYTTAAQLGRGETVDVTGLVIRDGMNLSRAAVVPHRWRPGSSITVHNPTGVRAVPYGFGSGYRVTVTREIRSCFAPGHALARGGSRTIDLYVATPRESFTVGWVVLGAHPHPVVGSWARVGHIIDR